LNLDIKINLDHKGSQQQKLVAATHLQLQLRARTTNM